MIYSFSEGRKNRPDIFGYKNMKEQVFKEESKPAP
jgi:hypothetical protein